MKKAKGFKEAERRELKLLLQEKTGYLICSNSLLEQIFTRSTYTASRGGENNEVLEFLGDQVLSYYLVKAVADRFGSRRANGEYAFCIREDRFTAIKQELVRNETLCQIIDSWGIAEYVIAGRSDWPNGLDDQPKVRADLFEAILGAIALESDWDTEILETAVHKMLSLDTRLDAIMQRDFRERSLTLNSAVRVLKEQAEQGQCAMPKYEFYGSDALGYDESGKPKWACRCTIVNAEGEITRSVEGVNKGDTKKTAAYLTLCAHLGVENAYGPSENAVAWCWKDGQLIPDHPTN